MGAIDCKRKNTVLGGINCIRFVLTQVRQTMDDPKCQKKPESKQNHKNKSKEF